MVKRLLPFAVLLLSAAQPEQAPIEPVSKLKLHHVRAEAVTYRGRRAVRITDAAPENAGDGVRSAILSGTNFQDGAIEVELAGDTEPGATPEYRGFTGVAFRVSADGSRYECFYVRPKNGRSEDQAQRNHSTQYISNPEFPWQRLRQEFPSQYESYVDLAPGEWTRIKIEVRGQTARLYVNGAGQPVLIVNDLKHTAAPGAVALWVGPKTVAHFANLRITPGALP